MRLLLATGNKHKIREIKSIFKVDGLDFATMADYPDLPEVVEDRDSFEGNAIKKASALAAATGLQAMADDSGLEVDSLDGAPGVYSARYSGVHGDDEANNRKLLDSLQGCMDRSARFRCVIALARGPNDIDTVEGVCEGRIAQSPAGANGFGYDPVFIPEGYDLTFAELDPEVKNSISHRFRALEKAYLCWFRSE